MKTKIYKCRIKQDIMIGDAIRMGVFDKFLAEVGADTKEYDKVLFARALNWAVPSLSYEYDTDLAGSEIREYKSQLEADEDKIFETGLSILNNDSGLIGDLVSLYADDVIKINKFLYPKDWEKRFPGTIRMRKLLFQSDTDLPPEEERTQRYKELFEKFNLEYGKFGKTLSQKSIDFLFSSRESK